MRSSLNFCSDQPFYPISDHKANKLESDNYKSTSHHNDHATQQMGVDVFMESMPMFESKGKVYVSWQADQQRIKNDHSTNKHGGAEHEAADQLLHKAQVVTLHSSTHTKAAGCEDHDQAGNVQVAAAGLISMRAGLRTCIFPQPPVGDLHLVAMEAAAAVQMQASMPAVRYESHRRTLLYRLSPPKPLPAADAAAPCFGSVVSHSLSHLVIISAMQTPTPTCPRRSRRRKKKQGCQRQPRSA